MVHVSNFRHHLFWKLRFFKVRAMVAFIILVKSNIHAFSNLAIGRVLSHHGTLCDRLNLVPICSGPDIFKSIKLANKSQAWTRHSRRLHRGASAPGASMQHKFARALRGGAVAGRRARHFAAFRRYARCLAPYERTVCRPPPEARTKLTS